MAENKKIIVKVNRAEDTKDVHAENLYNELVETYQKYQKSIVVAILVPMILFLVVGGLTKFQWPLLGMILIFAEIPFGFIPVRKYLRFLTSHGVTTINSNKVYKEFETIAYGEKHNLSSSPQRAKNSNRLNNPPSQIAKQNDWFNKSPSIKAKLVYISGLNLAEGALCKVVFKEDTLRIEAMSQVFTLAGEKLIGADIVKKSDITKQAVSSIGGATAGYALMGPLGAIIGGTSHSKTVKQVKKFLVISYFNEKEVKYIIFSADNRFSQSGKSYEAYDMYNAIKRYTKGKHIEVEL